MNDRLSHLLPKPEPKPRRCNCGAPTRGPLSATCWECLPGREGSGYGQAMGEFAPGEQRGDIQGNKRKSQERELAAKMQGRIT